MELRAGYKQTEAGLIPDDWGVSTIGEEFSIRLGKMLDAEKNVGEPKPFLGNRSVQWGRIDVSDLGLIKLTPSDLQRYRLREGDLLVCEGGEVGRSAIWKAPLDECYYQKALHRLRAKRGFNVLLLQNLLQRFADSGVLQNYVTQTSIAHLPKDKFETIPIPVPLSETEQQAIATSLSDADALIDALEQLLTKKRQIKQGAMQELLTGQRRLPGFAGEWAESEFGLWGQCHRGVSYNPDRDLYAHDTDSTFRLLRSNNVQGSQIALDGIQFVSVDRVSDNQRLHINDVLICMANGSRDLVGKAARFAVQDGFSYTFGAFMGAFRPNGNADPAYVYYCFHSDVFRKHIAILLAGSSINNLTPSSIESCVIRAPVDKDEQTAIATVLSDMDAEIATLEAKLAKARNVKQGMMQELLTGRIRLV